MSWVKINRISLLSPLWAHRAPPPMKHRTPPHGFDSFLSFGCVTRHFRTQEGLLNSAQALYRGCHAAGSSFCTGRINQAPSPSIPGPIWANCYKTAAETLALPKLTALSHTSTRWLLEAVHASETSLQVPRHHVTSVVIGPHSGIRPAHNAQPISFPAPCRPKASTPRSIYDYICIYILYIGTHVTYIHHISLYVNIFCGRLSKPRRHCTSSIRKRDYHPSSWKDHSTRTAIW